MVLNQPLISIVMCTYNRAAYIHETIESIRLQTHTNWELLIMDNGSADDTEGIVQQINDRRIHYYRHEPTTTGRLRNLAFDLAKGSYIALMDSDDLWLPEKLEQQMNALQQNPGIVFSFTNSRDFTGDKQIVRTLNRRTEGVEVLDTFLPFITNELLPAIQTFLFHKDCLRTCGRFGETRIFNDYEFIGNICYHFKAAVIFEPLLLRRLHGSNSVDVYSESLAEEYIDAIRAFKQNDMLQAGLANQLLFTAHANLGNVQIAHKKWRKAILNYLGAWKAKPLSFVPAKKIMKTMLHYLKS